LPVPTKHTSATILRWTSGLAVARGPCRLSGRNAMSEPRFTTLTPETMTADQKRVADAIQSGPRGAGLRGPFNALLRSPELCDLVQRVGAAFGERGVVDLVGAVGYYSLVSMTLNVAQVPLPAGVTPPLK